MVDLEMDQRGYHCPEPCIYFGGMTSFQHQDIQPAIAARGGISSFEPHRLPEHYDNTMPYGVPRYNAIQHQSRASSVDVGPSSFFPYLNTLTSGVPVNHVPPNGLPSSSNHGVNGVSLEDFEQNDYMLGNGSGSYKRKNAEGFPVNAVSAAAASSSFAAPVISRHHEGASGMDGPSFIIPPHRMTSNAPPMGEVISQRSVRNRLAGSTMDLVVPHGHSNFLQGSYLGQPFPVSGSIWFDQQLNVNHTDPSLWPQARSLPYMHGNNVGGVMMESVVPQYCEASVSRGSAAYIYPSPLNMHYPHVNRQMPALQGVRVHNAAVFPQLAAPAPYGAPATYAPQNAAGYRDGAPPADIEMGHVPSTGFRVYRQHHDGAGPDISLRHRNLPHLRVMPADEVAVLEFGEFYEAGNLIDRHRDMRMDIEDMSYEDLLALSERIGTVNTGVPEETVKRQLKTRSYFFSSAINLEEAPPLDQESDSCIICQDQYENHDTVGILGCGHEYHADCLKKWLFVKNVCPICKSEALPSDVKAV